MDGSPKSILEKLEDIFSVHVAYSKALRFTVQAEHYGDTPLTETLTLKELRQLGEELIDLANSQKEGKKND